MQFVYRLKRFSIVTCSQEISQICYRHILRLPTFVGSSKTMSFNNDNLYEVSFRAASGSFKISSSFIPLNPEIDDM